MFPASHRGRALELCLLAAGLVVSACASTGPGTARPLAPRAFADSRVESSPRHVSSFASRPNGDAKVESSSRRISRPTPRTRADSAALELAVTKRLAHRPLALALARRIRDPEFADRVASAVVYEAGRVRISPSLLAAVLLIENTPFDTTAVSTQGAVGLMQVMPVHVGSYGCLSGDLLNVEGNICHGARLLHTYLRRTKSMEIALRRYNGCVRGRNTPRCHRYPARVLRTASRLRHEILLAAAKLPDPSTEDRVVSSSRLAADLPREVEDADSLAAPADEPPQCGSFFACLRRSWGLNP